MEIVEKIKKVKQIGAWMIKHKYLCVIIFMASLILFFDQNSFLFQQLPMMSKNAKLEKEKAYYLNKIKQDSTMLSELQTNDDNLKKFAREHYYMRAEDEDVYIIEER